MKDCRGRRLSVPEGFTGFDRYQKDHFGARIVAKTVVTDLERHGHFGAVIVLESQGTFEFEINQGPNDIESGRP